MSFEDFTANKPSQVVMGLFNGQLLAVYFFSEGPQGVFDCHYTSCKTAPTGLVLSAGRRLAEVLLDSGAIELTAYVRKRNHPLRRAVEYMGFQPDCLMKFPPNELFVKYATRKNVNS